MLARIWQESQYAGGSCDPGHSAKLLELRAAIATAAREIEVLLDEERATFERKMGACFVKLVPFASHFASLYTALDSDASFTLSTPREGTYEFAVTCSAEDLAGKKVSQRICLATIRIGKRVSISFISVVRTVACIYPLRDALALSTTSLFDFFQHYFRFEHPADVWVDAVSACANALIDTLYGHRHRRNSVGCEYDLHKDLIN